MAKAFSFTYSKIKNFETCPLQHKWYDLDRTPGMEPSGEAIDYGNRVHDALAKALDPNKPAELPPAMRDLQYWVDYVYTLPGKLYVEQRWALRRDYSPGDWYRSPWMRYKCDVAVDNGKMGWLIDWKTGNRLEEPIQLWLGAATMFQLFPDLEVIDSMFIWLKEDDGRNSHECVSAETIRRNQAREIWEQLLPRIGSYEGAVNSGVFPPRPGRHCRWCKVKACEFFAQGAK